MVRIKVYLDEQYIINHFSYWCEPFPEFAHMAVFGNVKTEKFKMKDVYVQKGLYACVNN